MDKIVKAFQPHIDAAETWDIIHSKKFGWVMVIKLDRGEVPVFLQDRHNLMIVLAETFFDIVPGGTAKGMATSARQMMAPYLAQLPQDCTATADVTLGLLAKLDD